MLLAEWSPQDWATLLIAIPAMISAVLSAVAAFLANLAKIRSEENSRKVAAVDAKLDDNTALTVAGTAVAVNNAKVAASAATDAAEKADSALKVNEDKMILLHKIDEQTNGSLQAAKNAVVVAEAVHKKLNGGIDAAIDAAVKPLMETLEDHVLQDTEALKMINENLDDIRRRIK